MKQAKKVGFFRKLLLILLTKMQEVAVRDTDSRMYYMLTSLHFKLYFSKDLIEEALDNSDTFKLAAQRHGKIVVSKLYSDRKNPKRKKLAYNMAKRAFRDNLLLECNV